MDAVSIRSINFIDKQLTARKVDSLSLLPKETRKQIRAEARKMALDDVFGFDHRTDKEGNPIEQGQGAPGNQTRQSIEAYKKYCDPGNPKATTPEVSKEAFDANLKRMEAELAKSDARRRAARAAEDDDE